MCAQRHFTRLCRSSCRSILNMASISSENVSAKKTAVKDVQGFIHGVSDIKTPGNPNSTRYLILFCKEMRRGGLFASMQTSMKKWSSRRNRSFQQIFLTLARKNEDTERESNTKWTNSQGFHLPTDSNSWTASALTVQSAKFFSTLVTVATARTFGSHVSCIQLENVFAR